MSGYGKQIATTVAVGVFIALVIGLGIYYANPAKYALATSLSSSSSTVMSPETVCETLPSIAQMNATSNPSSGSANFAIIDADSGPFAGMNGSATLFGGPSTDTTTFTNQSSTATTTTKENTLSHAPIMKVYLGQVVTIATYDCSSETQGLAVSYYQPSSIIIQPNESSAITFTANETGNFQVYDLISPLHPFTQNGLLIVENRSS